MHVCNRQTNRRTYKQLKINLAQNVEFRAGDCTFSLRIIRYGRERERERERDRERKRKKKREKEREKDGAQHSTE